MINRNLRRSILLALAATIATSLNAGELRNERNPDDAGGGHAISWYSPPSHGKAGLTAIASYEKGEQRPSLYVLQLSFAGSAHRFGECKRAFWRIDGRPAAQIASNYSQRTSGSVHLELFTGKVSRENLQRLASASKIDVQICAEKVVVEADDLNGLKQLLQTTSN